MKRRESDILKAVTEFLEYSGWRCFRLNSGKIIIRNGPKVRAVTLNRPGTADLLAIRPWGTEPRVLWVECKRPGEKQTKEQIEFQAWAERANCVYVVATCVEDLMSFR